MYVFCFFCARPVIFCLRLLCISSVSFVHGQSSSVLRLLWISSVSFVHGQFSSEIIGKSSVYFVHGQSSSV